MSTITKERVAEIIHAAGLEPCDYEEVFGSIKTGEIVAMARIALASLEAEPVGEVSEQRDGLVMDGTVDLGGASTHRIIKGASKMKRLPLGTKFYTAPPAPVSVPDAMEMDDDFDSAFEHGKAVGWNACRAAMLQSFGNSEQLNSPVIADGWVACSERLPETDGNYWGWWSESKRQGPVWFIKSELQAQFQSSEITHWMPLPAAPQQEVK
ncbi:TPA: DUF551 domain-containing protein [Enterobacter cloacae]